MSDDTVWTSGTPDEVYAQARHHYVSGNLPETIRLCRALLERTPAYGAALQLLGTLAHREGRFELAVKCFRHALASLPDTPGPRSNLAIALKDCGKLKDAEQQLHILLAQHPSLLAGYYNFAGLLERHHRLDAAITAYRRATALDPGCVDAHWNLALALLRTGRFAEGWTEYEWRWQRPGTPVEHRTIPAWDGGPLDGRTLLLVCEQGLGDTLQFLRYIRILRERLLSGSVILRCQAELVRLLEGYPGVDHVMTTREPPPSCDVQASLMSLPGLCNTTLVTIPSDVPYLHSPVRHTISPGEGMRVGLVWGSSATDPSRSCPLAALTWIGAIPGLRVFSLQKGPHQSQLTDTPGAGLITDLSESINDMADTAAILQELDLVVTVDTSVAHLAGALGRPTWIMLPHLADWRWLLDRDDSPWYPTARLFRQTAPKDWGGVVMRLKEALVEHLQTWRRKP